MLTALIGLALTLAIAAHALLLAGMGNIRLEHDPQIMRAGAVLLLVAIAVAVLAGLLSVTGQA